MNSRDKLKLSGIKITPHKIEILDLFAEHGHMDATQIVKLLDSKSIDISLATVYRILSSFEANQLIRKHNFGNDQAIYELNRDNEHHDHLICLRCGQVIEFVNQQIEDLQALIAEQNQFKVSNHTLNIYGLCQECDSKTK